MVFVGSFHCSLLNISIYHNCNLASSLYTFSSLMILKSIHMMIIPNIYLKYWTTPGLQTHISNCLDISVCISNKHLKLNMLGTELVNHFMYLHEKSPPSSVIPFRVNLFFNLKGSIVDTYFPFTSIPSVITAS